MMIDSTSTKKLYDTKLNNKETFIVYPTNISEQMMRENNNYFLQAFTTSPIYMEWMPAGKWEYIFLGTSLLKKLGSKGAAYIILQSKTIFAYL